ncbi:MAG: protein kinase [Polyangiaceae bacterium]|nr:protein kinase [Polyangiaceae bacterium]
MELGRGGIGRILVALDRHLGREIAIKQLLPTSFGSQFATADTATTTSHKAADRLLREARVTGQLEHPNIVPVYEVGRQPDGSPYYTMRIVRGRTLAQAIEEHPALDARLKLVNHFSGLCHAIAYAHSRGVIHRDIKPENVMIGEFGETVVLDWGIAKVKGSSNESNPQLERSLQVFYEAQTNKTVDGSVFGTPSFMSPEQAMGRVDEVDELSDTWSLGAVLYTILAGRPPFRGQLLLAILDQVIRGPIVPLHQIDRRIPKELAAIAARALCRNRSERYQSARELARDIEAFQSGTRVAAYEYSSLELLNRFVDKNRSAVVVAGAGAAIMAVLGLDAYSRVVRARDRAVAAEQAALQSHRNAERNLAEAYVEKAQTALTRGSAVAVQIFASQALSVWERADARGMLVNAWNMPRPEPQKDVRLEERCSMVSYSYQSQSLVCANAKQIVLWDAGNNLWLARWTDQTSDVTAVAISDEGDVVASGHADGSIKLWSVLRNTELTRLSGHRDVVTSLVFSKTGPWIGSGSRDRTACVWEREGNSPVARWAISDWVSAVMFNPAGNLLAIGSRMGPIHVWDWRNKDAPRPFESHQGTVATLTFSPNGMYLASGAFDQSVRIWTVATGTMAGDPIPVSTAVMAAAWSPNGKYLAFGGQDRRLLLLTAELRSEMIELMGHDGEIRMVGFSPDSQTLMSSGGSLSLRPWYPVAPLQPRRIIEQGNVLALGFDPKGRWVVTAGLRDNGVALWGLADGKRLAKLPTLSSTARSLAVSSDGSKLAVAGSDGNVYLWDPNTQTPLNIFRGHEQVVRSVAFSPDAKVLATTGEDGRVLVWETASGQRTTLFEEATEVFNSVAFSPNGKTLATAGRDGRVRLFDLDSRSLSGILEGHDDWVMDVAFSPDAKRLASAGADGKVVEWDIQLRTKLAVLEGHTSRVLSVAYDRTADLIATGGEDETVRIWDSRDHRCAAILQAHTATVRRVMFAPHAELLASAADDGTTRFWDLNPLRRSAAEVLALSEKLYRVRARGTNIEADR